MERIGVVSGEREESPRVERARRRARALATRTAEHLCKYLPLTQTYADVC
jgi:hypothetical protein